MTKDKIEQNGIGTRNEAMSAIIADAESFTDVEVGEEWTAPADKNQPAISGVYAAEAGGETIAYCVESKKPKGLRRRAAADRRVNTDGTIAGAQVTAHGRTRALAHKAQSDKNWITQFAGQPADGSLAVSKDGGTINAITGSTITSRAVTLGVNTAANCVASLG